MESTEIHSDFEDFKLGKYIEAEGAVISLTFRNTTLIRYGDTYREFDNLLVIDQD